MKNRSHEFKKKLNFYFHRFNHPLNALLDFRGEYPMEKALELSREMSGGREALMDMSFWDIGSIREGDALSSFCIINPISYRETLLCPPR